MTLADLLNAPTEMEFEGVTYRLREPTLLEEGEFQRWLESRAREAAGRATDLPDEDRRNLLRDVTADIASGRYAFGGEECLRALRTEVGWAKLVAIVLRDQGVSDQLAARMVNRRLREIVAVMRAEGESYPKALAEVLSRLGLPADFLSSSSNSRTPRSTAAPANSPA